jgi:hypothetical protein
LSAKLPRGHAVASGPKNIPVNFHFVAPLLIERQPTFPAGEASYFAPENGNLSLLIALFRPSPFFEYRRRAHEENSFRNIVFSRHLQLIKRSFARHYLEDLLKTFHVRTSVVEGVYTGVENYSEGYAVA